MTTFARRSEVLEASCVVFALLSPAVADATRPASVLVVARDTESALALRVDSELRSLGLHVQSAPRSAALPSPDALEALVRNAGAGAAVRVVPPGPLLEVWILDRGLDLFSVHDVVRARDAGEPLDSLAVRAAEVVRASLLEIGGGISSLDEIEPPSASAAAEPAPPPRADAPTRRAETRAPMRNDRRGGNPFAGASLSAGVVHHPSEASLDPAPIGALAGHLLLWRDRLGAGLVATFPLWTTAVADARASGLVLEGLVAAGPHLVATRAGRFSLALEAGGGIAWLHATGRADPPLAARSDATFSPLLLLRALPRVRVWGPLHARADLMAGAVTREIRVRLAGHVAAAWGLPVLGATGGVELDLR